VSAKRGKKRPRGSFRSCPGGLLIPEEDAGGKGSAWRHPQMRGRCAHLQRAKCRKKVGQRRQTSCLRRGLRSHRPAVRSPSGRGIPWQIHHMVLVKNSKFSPGRLCPGVSCGGARSCGLRSVLRSFLAPARGRGASWPEGGRPSEEVGGGLEKNPWCGEENTRRKAVVPPCGDARALPGRFLPRFPTLPVRSGGGPLPSWGSRYGAPSKADGTPGGGWGILIKPFSFVGAVLCSKGIFLEGGPHDTFGPPLRPKPHSGHAAGACRKTPGRCTSRTPRGSRGPGAGGAEAEGISPGTGGPPESFSR